MKKTTHSTRQPIGMALRTLASKECRSLQQALETQQDHQDGIHDARRSCRRLRSLLAFLSTSSNDPRIAKTHKALRKLTHGFADLRDAHVAVRTAQKLAGPHASLPAPLLIQQLESRSDAWLEAALHEDPAWAQRRGKAERIIKDIEALNWQHVTPAIARATLKHSARRMKKARRMAQEQRSDDAFHRWRRRARQLRYQLEFLRKARRLGGRKKSRLHQYDQRVRQLSLIIDRLGWRQDFQVFLHTLDQLPATHEITALRAVLAKTNTAPRKTSARRVRDSKDQ